MKFNKILEGQAIDVLVNTRHFGEIELDESKILYFDRGILGFEDNTRFTLLYDNESGEKPDISWLQCVDEPTLAIPVVSPFLVKQDYNPDIEDELLTPLGNLSEDNIVVLISVTVPSDITRISANLRAPFIINSDSRKGAQIIIENSEYAVKYYFYDQLNSAKTVKGGV